MVIYLQAIAFFALIAVAAAGLLPTQQPSADAQAQVLRSESAVNPDSFQYAYETSNGIHGQEAGQLKQIGESQGIATQGEFAWTGQDGQPISFSYIADENGKITSIIVQHLNEPDLLFNLLRYRFPTTRLTFANSTTNPRSHRALIAISCRPRSSTTINQIFEPF